ncbi:MAG: hypothetical protein HIU93_08670 [Acidobacteria bacterium]|nr:hypothetical protein [Acidobacteriota bacterium]
MKLLVRLFAVTILAGSFLSVVHAQASSGSGDQLHEGFVDPPRDFSPMPFWFWNGRMEGPEIQKEIHAMVDQHVYGAFLHARDGLETPYLSDGWWKAIGSGLEESKKDGFEFNFVDEYDWPSGEVRNVQMSGNHQSEVLARHPEYRMQTLAYDSKVVHGPQAINLPADRDTEAVVAARWLGRDRIDSESLRLLNVENGHVQWSVPDGDWVVLQFHLQPAMGFDGGFVDLMNPDAMKLYFKLSYGEYYRRFASYFGNTIHYSFADHEGDYGYRIAWTPELFQAFEKRTGYDLRKVLPLLIYDGGDTTTKVRTDYLSTVTQLYAASFWDGITTSARKLGIQRTGHAWEESLQWSAALQGSLFSVERGLNPVGVDSLEDFGRQPLNFKVAQSVADFEGRRFMCENQGVQGTNSYLDMEGMRKGTNAIGAWGVNLFVPHAFDYDASRANYPPDWLHQPFWPYFHYYADYTRRISYMNADSSHVTNVLLYYPITSIWAHTAPLFSGSTSYQEIGRPAAWKNETILINDYYTRMILQLADHHWDYNIADDQYLDSARVEGNELVIGPQRFRAIILPPLTTLSRNTLRKIDEFHKAGGVVLAIRMLPSSSPEAGGNDAVIKTGMDSLFGGEDSSSGNAGAYYIADSVNSLIATLDAKVPKDVRIIEGPSQHLYFEHRRKLQKDYYWVVNDTDRARINQVHFAAKGIPEKWNALTGAREPLFYRNGPDGTEVRLNLAPWDAFYIVFKPLTGSGQDAELVSTNAETVDSVSRQGNLMRVHLSGPADQATTFVTLHGDKHNYEGEVSTGSIKPLVLAGDWQFRPQPERISVPYAKVKDAPEAEGERRGWEREGADDTDWPSLWLSEEQGTVRKWEMIGPFPNTDNNGFNQVFPPEKEFDPHKKYEGLNAQIVGWKQYDGNEPHLALENWDIWMSTSGGRDSDAAYVTQFNPELLTNGDKWVVSYAHTYLYSPKEQHAQFIVAADNWARIWLNNKPVYGQLRTPFWYELNDHWADKVPVELKAGWNDVLVKVGKGRGVSSGFYGFSFRVADDNGNTLRDVTASFQQKLGNESPVESSSMRWYRIAIPPGCVAVVPPALQGHRRMLVNGHPATPSGNEPVDIRKFLNGDRNSLVIIASQKDRLDSPVQFVTGDTPFPLTSWTKTGLANYSGSAIYSKSFTLPASFHGQRVVLDLGQISSVADVYVNGKSAGTLVWSPYRLDITNLLRQGQNQLRIVVTNTEANHRAVGTSHHLLQAIDKCGLEGPVRLIPYMDKVITLHEVASK